MRPDTHARKNSLKSKLWLSGFFLLPLFSCRQEPGAVDSPGLRVRVAPLHDYAWRDRRQSGQPTDLKPEAERKALLQELTRQPADLLILRGLGSEAALRHLQNALAEAGAEYPHLYYIPGPDVYSGIGFLLKTAASESRELSAQRFRIKEQSYQPLAGGVRISTPEFPDLWIWNQQAPSPEESYERRRNEARILAQHIRPQIQAGAEVLLSLHSREDYDSPMFRLLEEAGLLRLVPEDSRGDSWTHRDPNGILYRQDQWLFATPGLARRLTAPQIFDSGDLRTAGPYRHQGVLLP